MGDRQRGCDWFRLAVGRLMMKVQPTVFAAGRDVVGFAFE